MGKRAKQVAAIPMRLDKKGRLRLLLVTSRGSKRWVPPKGWIMDGKKPWRAAEIEALEEAGVRGYIAKKKLGTYKYTKILDDGDELKCKVTLYPMVVEKVEKRWKERRERTRHWFSAKGASKAVDEHDLAQLLRKLHKSPKKVPIVKEILKQS